ISNGDRGTLIALDVAVKTGFTARGDTEGRAYCRLTKVAVDKKNRRGIAVATSKDFGQSELHFPPLEK
ncbi:MAG: hypothetical protein J6U31_09040, partial [Bacteroidales bacterium]|nr:hypothetical protein [Bacteroidales bacterium]